MFVFWVGFHDHFISWLSNKYFIGCYSKYCGKEKLLIFILNKINVMPALKVYANHHKYNNIELWSVWWGSDTSDKVNCPFNTGMPTVYLYSVFLLFGWLQFHLWWQHKPAVCVELHYSLHQAISVLA